MKLRTGLLLTAANGGLAVAAPVAGVPAKWSVIIWVVQAVVQVVVQVLAQQSPPSSTLPPVKPLSQ